MRDLKRIARICNKLKELWKKHPDQRLGQLLVNYIYHRDELGQDGFIWFEEDYKVETILDELLKQENMNLLETIQKIWKEKVFQDVIRNRIWMEADMVASFYHHIQKYLEDNEMDIYLEDRPFIECSSIDESLDGYRIDATIYKKKDFPKYPVAVLEFKHILGQYPPKNKQQSEGIGKDIKKLNAFKRYDNICYEVYS